MARPPRLDLLRDAEVLLAGREVPSARRLLDAIRDINPTGRALSSVETRRRYALKNRLQSLLIVRYGDALQVRPVETLPGTVSLWHPTLGDDACHAVLAGLSDEARSWVRFALDTGAHEEPSTSVAVTAPRPAGPTAAPEALARARAALDEFDFDAARAALEEAMRDPATLVEGAGALVALLVDHLALDQEALALAERLPSAALKPQAVQGLLAVAAARQGDRVRASGWLPDADPEHAAEAEGLLARDALARGDVPDADRWLSALRARTLLSCQSHRRSRYTRTGQRRGSSPSSPPPHRDGGRVTKAQRGTIQEEVAAEHPAPAGEGAVASHHATARVTHREVARVGDPYNPDRPTPALPRWINGAVQLGDEGHSTPLVRRATVAKNPESEAVGGADLGVVAPTEDSAVAPARTRGIQGGADLHDVREALHLHRKRRASHQVTVPRVDTELQAYVPRPTAISELPHVVLAPAPDRAIALERTRMSEPQGDGGHIVDPSQRPARRRGQRVHGAETSHPKGVVPLTGHPTTPVGHAMENRERHILDVGQSLFNSGRKAPRTPGAQPPIPQHGAMPPLTVRRNINHFGQTLDDARPNGILGREAKASLKIHPPTLHTASPIDHAVGISSQGHLRDNSFDRDPRRAMAGIEWHPTDYGTCPPADDLAKRRQNAGTVMAMMYLNTIANRRQVSVFGQNTRIGAPCGILRDQPNRFAIIHG